jgi:hypothetical protein
MVINFTQPPFAPRSEYSPAGCKRFLSNEKKKPPEGGFSIATIGSHQDWLDGTDRIGGLATILVAGLVGIVSAAISSVSSGGSCADRGSSDAYRYATAYGCATVDATAIDTTVVNTGATSSNASSVCEGVS